MDYDDFYDRDATLNAANTHGVVLLRDDALRELVQDENNAYSDTVTVYVSQLRRALHEIRDWRVAAIRGMPSTSTSTSTSADAPAGKFGGLLPQGVLDRA